MDDEQTPMRPQLFSNKLYDFLKFCTTILLPATGGLYFTLAEVWHWPNAHGFNATINALILFMGLILGLSTKSYNGSTTKYDGEIVISNVNDEESTLNVRLSADDIEKKKQLILKVHK